MKASDVCLYANIRIFKQITTIDLRKDNVRKMFVSMQIYEFLSKSQQNWFSKNKAIDVCLYANIRIFKQITTQAKNNISRNLMFVSMQIYEFLSKSQPGLHSSRV